MFKFLIARSPITGQELSGSDWWEVLTRHKSFTCAEDSMVLVTHCQLEKHEYRIFKLNGYLVGEEFNIKRIKEDN